MLWLIIALALMQMPNAEWHQVEPFEVKSALEFSPIQGDDAVTSSYFITILEEQIPVSLDKVAAFRVEIVLKSGYSISNVVNEWKKVEVESASGILKMNAIELAVVVEGWNYWDMEVFSTVICYKTKEKQKIKL